MPFAEYVRQALEALRASPLRSALTLLGMVVGVFSVIASVTAVKVLEAYFNDTFRGMGANTFYVSRMAGGMQMGPRDASERNRPNLTYEDLEMLRRRAKLPTSIGPDGTFAYTKVSADGRDTDPNVALRGINEDWAVNNGFEVAEGRFITEDDVRYARPVVVLGAPVATRLFDGVQALGKTIRMEGARYQVVGVFEPKEAFMGNAPDNIVMAPITRLFDVYGGTDRNISYDVRAPSSMLMQATVDEVTGHLRAIRKVRPQDDNNFAVVTNDALRGPMESFTGSLTVGGVGVGLIALLAAGIGIMNIMLVSVTERTREIGIRKSLGARRRDVLAQFLIETLVLCQLGGLLGIALGVAGGNLMVTLAPGAFRLAFPWVWAGIAVVGVTLVALVFGVYPAYKAATLRPVEALRHE
jgi:putative ABC transport system permease protein